MGHQSAIVVFDIRNFSAHRELLGLHQNAGPLTRLVVSLLNEAVSGIRRWREFCGCVGQPAINHTGDGFIAVIPGEGAGLAALLFVSEYRETASRFIREYTREAIRVEPDVKTLPKLDYGIGIHLGSVQTVSFDDFNGRRRGFLGTAVNLACRVEQCTKDHVCNVLCSLRAWDSARKANHGLRMPVFDRYFSKLGQHRLPKMEQTMTFWECKKEFHTACKRVRR